MYIVFGSKNNVYKSFLLMGLKLLKNIYINFMEKLNLELSIGKVKIQEAK